MDCLRKKIVVILLMIVAIFTVKLDAKAEIIYNTAGEKTPQGEEYYAKYWSGNQWRYYLGNSNDYPKCIDITYDVTYCYEEAYKMIDLVNEQRKKAGVPELKAKDELMDVAMMRAAETAIYWSHTRPSGFNSSSASKFSNGENCCAGAPSAIKANASLVESSGHYETMIDKRYAYAGYGCVKVDNTYYWVQIFSIDKVYYEDGYDAKFHQVNDKYIGRELVYCPLSPNDRPVQWDKMTLGNRKDYTAKFTAKVNPKFISIQCKSDDAELYVGGETKGYAYTYYNDAGKKWTCKVVLSPEQCDVKVLTPSLCSYSNGKIQALKAGTAKIQYTLKADRSLSVTLEIKIKEKAIKNGSKVTVNGNTYKVTSTKNKEISFYQTSSNAASVTIPKTVKIQGKTYKVTSVAANAFKNNKKLTSVTIGSNITKIGSKAFYGCSKLKKITVKSSKLKSVGKNALQGIYKKAVIKVPKGKYTKYKNLFKNKGQKKTVIIKK